MLEPVHKTMNNPNSTVLSQEAIRDLVLKARSGELVTHKVAEKPIEEFIDQASATIIAHYEIPYRETSLKYRTIKGGISIPCMVQSIAFQCAVFISKARETMGQRMVGVSIIPMGYDVETDDGKIVLEEILNPAWNEGDPEENKMLHFPKLVTEDEEGKPIEKFGLMIFKPQWGVDMSRSRENTPRGIDMLNLNPGKGVPRKKRDANTDAEEETEGAVTVEQAKRAYENIDWSQISNLQHALEAPIMTAEEEGIQELIMFKNHIPIAKNAPSVKEAERKAAKEQATTPGFSTPVTTVTDVAPNHDPFGGLEDEETDPEATTVGEGEVQPPPIIDAEITGEEPNGDPTE